MITDESLSEMAFLIESGAPFSKNFVTAPSKGLVADELIIFVFPCYGMIDTNVANN